MKTLSKIVKYVWALVGMGAVMAVICGATHHLCTVLVCLFFYIAGIVDSRPQDDTEQFTNRSNNRFSR